jgi:hypothetical protein
MHEQRSGCDVTKRILRPDGEVQYVRCVGVPVVEDGVFKAFHGTTIDVTEQELLTQELRRQQSIPRAHLRGVARQYAMRNFYFKAIYS